jgi:hypothetical protein
MNASIIVLRTNFYHAGGLAGPTCRVRGDRPSMALPYLQKALIRDAGAGIFMRRDPASV